MTCEGMFGEGEKVTVNKGGRNTFDVGEVNNHCHVLSHKTHKRRNELMIIEIAT